MSVLYNQVIIMNEDLKVGDIVYRKKEHCMWNFQNFSWPFTVTSKYNNDITIECKDCVWLNFKWNWDADRFYIFKNTNLTPPPMQYFHTAALIAKKPATTSETITSIEWTELEPYKVRTATSREDLEKTLLRELDKSIDHNDVKFLINPIF